MPSSPARLLAALALLAGCAADPPPRAPPPPAPGYAPPPAPAAPPVDPRSVVTLPFSTSPHPLPTGLPVVLVSRQAIAFQEGGVILPLPPPDRWSQGVDAAYKRSGPNDLQIVPLSEALDRARRGDGHSVAIGVDANVPYRILVEVLFSAGQARYDTFHLLTRSAGGFGAIVTVAPRVGGPHRRPAVPRLSLAVIVTTSGLSVKTSFGNVAPGCADIGPGLTLPRGPGGLDLAGLRACAASWKHRDPSLLAETEATLMASPDVPFGEIVAVMDALRLDPQGRPAFPEVVFGVPR